MTVSSNVRKAGPLSCNGVVTTFGFDFTTTDDDDIQVILATSAGVESTLVKTSGYTVSLNADQTSNPGGTITTTTTYAAGYTITIIGALALSQETELTNLGGFYPKVIERAIDRTVIYAQQLDEVLDRALRLPASSGADPELPLPVANRALGWNSTADALTNVASVPAVAVSPFAETILDDSTGLAMRTTLGIGGSVTVMDHGATGLGVTDDSSGFSAALAAGTHAFAPPGNYKVTAGFSTVAGKTLELLPGAYFSGAGTITRVAGDRVMSFSEGAQGDVWYWGKKLTGAHSIGAGKFDGYSPSAFHFDVRADDVDGGSDFVVGQRVRHLFGGSAAKGGRIGHYTALLQTAATHSSNGARNYVASQASVYAQANDNGTNTGAGAAGAYFGLGAAAYTEAAATNLYSVAAAEFNTFINASSSMRYQLGLTIAGANGTRGVDYDCALNISGLTNAITHVGWKTGILFSAANGAEPFYASSTLIQTASTGTISRGIDFYTHTITNEVIRGRYMGLKEHTLLLGDSSGVATISGGGGPTANTSLYIYPGGTGSIYLRNGDGVDFARFDRVASAVNSFVFTQAASGNAPEIAVAGSGNIDLKLTPLGSGMVTTGTGGYAVSATKVVGARDTGWTAMTGTANKNTAYDTSTVTLAQLAGRVMSLQAALTTHGLLGA